jgi:hypothetical protein
MKNQERATTNQEPRDYRGALVYRQEDGYKMVTMTVSVRSNEQSQVTSHAYNLPVSEEAEHIQKVDVYHFPATDGTRIQLTIDSATASKEAWYTVNHNDIVADHSPISMSIVRSSESMTRDPEIYSQEALDRALSHYADKIPDWLNESPKSTLTPDHELDSFGR